MAGKFECYKDKAGEVRFRLKAGNLFDDVGEQNRQLKHHHIQIVGA